MKKLVYIATTLLIISCSKPPSPPGPVQLIYPSENLECTTGTLLGENVRQVNFKWAQSAHTSAYRISIIDLDTHQSYSSTTSNTAIDYNLITGKAYSWRVTASNSEVSETSVSPVWYFFVAGATSSHTPYQAVAINPEPGSFIDFPANGSINLQWIGVDSDNDIVSFTLYFDTVDPPQNKETLANVQTSNHTVSVSRDTRYYWKVNILDSQGNKSESNVFDFKVN